MVRSGQGYGFTVTAGRPAHVYTVEAGENPTCVACLKVVAMFGNVPVGLSIQLFVHPSVVHLSVCRHLVFVC